MRVDNNDNINMGEITDIKGESVKPERNVWKSSQFLQCVILIYFHFREMNF